MSLTRFHEMLETGKNVLVHPSVWDDPYEKAMSRSSFIVKDKDEIRSCNFNENNWYAQCWSTASESDALWHIFASDRKKKFVKIKTTYGLLQNSLKITDEEKEDETVPCYILEKVNYVNDNKAEFEKSIKEWGDYFKHSIPEVQQLCLGLLLTKRSAFKHEDEVRLLRYREPISNSVTDMDEDYRFYKYTVDCRRLIMEVEFDPWTEKICRGEKKKIALKIGRGKVRKSKLYEDPIHTQYIIKKHTELGTFKKLIKIIGLDT